MQLRSVSKIAVMLLLGLLFIAQPSWAGRVVKVKGKKVLIILDQEEVDSTFKGDALYTTTRSGKKRGIVVIRKMKGNKVIAQLKKGKASSKMLTRPRKARKKKPRPQEPMMEEASEVAQVESDDRSDFPEMMFGVLGTFGQATQNVNNVADMSGNLLGVKVAIDYELFSNLGVKARLGMDMLTVSGSASNIDFETSINYITVDFFLRYYLMRSSSFGLFGNVGMGIYSPMSTDLGPSGQQALQEDSISTTSVGIIGLGISIPIGGMELQLGGDYYFFPPSDDVETSVIAGKLGLFFEL